MAQMELATDVIIKALRAAQGTVPTPCELGVLVGGAERTSHMFGRRISRHYQGDLQTVLIHREAGHPVCVVLPVIVRKRTRAATSTSDRILRTETCL